MSNPVDQDHRRYRINNSLMLPVCADVLAAPFHGQALPEPLSVDAVLRTPAVVAQHLNTVHTLTVAEHLTNNDGSLDEDELATALAQQWSTGMHPDPSPGTVESLSHIHSGMPWWDAAAEVGRRHRASSADPAVRSTPCGLLPGADLATIAMLARRTASITHADALSRDGAAIAAVAVALAAAEPADRLSPQRFLAVLASHTRSNELRRGLAVAGKLVGHRAGPAETAAIVGNTGAAERAVPAALTGFLRYHQDPAAAIRYAILIGGQTRSIAAITAAITGAHHPTDQLPAQWKHLTRPANLRNFTVAAGPKS